MVHFIFNFQERNIWNSELIQSHLTSVIQGAEANYRNKLQELLYELRSQMEMQYDDAKRKIEDGLKVGDLLCLNVIHRE